jgi:ParB family transcriptional regulator, chromosome partitioning protein
MPKASRDALNAKGKRDAYTFDPDDLVLVTDERSPIYDPRVNLEVNQALVSNILFDPGGDGVPQGVLEPVLVRRNTETGKVEVVDGRQRVKAAREANKRLRKQGHEPIWIPTLLQRGGDARVMGVLISANEHRTEDLPSERARKAQRYIDLGRSEDEVATLLGVSRATVKNLLSLLDAPADIRKAADAGKIAVAGGYKLSRMEPEEARKRLAELLEKAPRTPGKRRSPNAAKARAITNGSKAEPEIPAKDGASVKAVKAAENKVATTIADWIERSWNEADWSGDVKEIPDRIRKGEWRETVASKGE